MKKTTIILLTILLVALSSSYSQEIFKKSTYELTENLKSKSSTIYIKENKKGELLCVKERFKTTSSKVTYSFYLYNKDKKLLKSSLLKIKPINKVFFQNDSIYLIRYKKKHLEVSQEEKDAAEYGLEEDFAFNLLDKVNFSILSSSTKDFKFEEQKWFTIKNEGTHWDTNPDKFETSFFENSSENKLLHLSSFSYLPNKQELEEANYKILASDSLKRTKFYSSTFYIDFLDKNLKQELTKKVIISNNIGPFSIKKNS